MLALKIHVPKDIIIDDREAAEAARMGVSELVREHLRTRDRATARNKNGLPKSSYWADAADSVTSEVNGAVATVTVEKEGAALHYYGGIVYPKTGKALAIPLDASVAGKNPREVNALTDYIALMWPKNSSHGFLKDEETGDLLWLLIPKATIKADESVMPAVAEIEREATEAILEAAT